MKEFDIESPVKLFEMDENEFVTGDESDFRNPKLPTGLVDGISVTEFSPRPGLPPVSELLSGSSIESKATFKGYEKFLREDEFDLDPDFGKPMSPTGHPQCLLRLVPEIDILDELCLKINFGDDPAFVIVDDKSVTELSPRPGLPPVSSIESKATLKGSRNLLRGDEFDPEAAARELEWHLTGRKIDFKFERPVKLFERENIEMDYKNLDEFLSKKKIKKNEDESDFGKPMSPTGHPQCLLPLVPEIERDILEELCLKINFGDDPAFVIVDDKSVTELSPRPGLPPVSSIESKAALKGSRNLLRGDEFDPEAAARELEWHLMGRKIDFKFERPVKLFERESIGMDYKNLDEFLSKKNKLIKNEDEFDLGKPMSPTGHPQCLLRLAPEIDIVEELC